MPLEGLPFDERQGVIPNEAGRVTHPESGEQLSGHYAGRIPVPAEDVAPIEVLLAERGRDHVTYLGWQAIDRAEVAAGEPHGRLRIKFCRVDEMIEAARVTA